ncbi:helix-hairpin-helix domain-containing protein [Haloarchaeobius amylolyticus]|uniref:helix-hairpin-helix domain-containing protein n=1 Tax=Haloarchaeobius amylolyticus TaxID=1198296 RepID=UPI002271A576|nr:helix-hairpin-helix domain-containing protein [Haloarchaeobius amylolyticus]
MKAITKSGVSIPCENFKAIEEGVLLFDDEKRKQLVGFVPHADLQFVVPDDVAASLDVGEPEPAPVVGGHASRDDEIAWGEATGEGIGIEVDHGPVASPVEVDEPATTENESDLPVEQRRARAMSELTEIHGLGPTYADRLRSAGITTLGGLSMARPDHVASAVGVSKRRAEIWIDRATEMQSQAEPEQHRQGADEASVANRPDSWTWT